MADAVVGGGEKLRGGASREGPFAVTQVSGDHHRAATDNQPSALGIALGLDAVEPGIGQRRDLPPQRDQPPVPGQQAGVAAGARLGPVEPGALERGRVLRVGHGNRIPAEGGELGPPSLAHGLAEPGIVMAGEVLERGARAPLLALEQQRHERRGEQQRGGHPQPAVAHQRAGALARGAVADLVVVLGGDDELAA
jgi:hypothetical protein